ncbi:proprotein convertase subtilisin/kexin type 5-like [Dugong dugon]
MATARSVKHRVPSAGGPPRKTALAAPSRDKLRRQRVLFQGECREHCPVGHYPAPQHTCLPCPDHCALCQGPHVCKRCADGYFLLPTNHTCRKLECAQGGRCVTKCGPGFYGDPEVGECEPCHRACKTCTGFGYDECSSCQEGLQLLHGKCVGPAQTRVEGKFWNASVTGFLARGFYAEAGLCERCSSPCRTCEGDATHCFSCEGGFVLEQGLCREACSERHVAVEGVCRRCPEMCQDCIHEETCKECMPDFFLYNDTCHQSCPQGFYEGSRQCVPCHEDCLECSGPGEDDCYLCADTFLVFYDGQCLDECPAGTYFQKGTNDCQVCHKTCQTCTSWGPCTTCQEGLRKNSHGRCVAYKECTHAEYWDEEAHRCKPCHARCLRCTGPAEDQCRACPRESLLLTQSFPTQVFILDPKHIHRPQGHCLIPLVPPHPRYTVGEAWDTCGVLDTKKSSFPDMTCVKDCPEGYYADEESHQCAPCHSSCRTCEGRHSTQCQSCWAGWFQLGKECLPQCREGYYAENTTSQCERCNMSCKACRGPRPVDCLSCDTFFFLLRSKGECYRTCPEHYYADQSTQTCERCHPTCDKCKGKGALNCLSCVWSYHLVGGICTSDCLTGKYRVGEGDKFNCENCHESCVECKGPGAKNCTECPANLLLHMDDNRCLRCCNTSDPTDTQECCDCQDTIEECILRPSEIGPAAEHSRTALFIVSSIMLVLLLGAAVIVWRRSRSRAQPTKKAGYEKLAKLNKAYSSTKSSHRESSSFEEDQVIEYRDHDYDDNDEDDIVYMGPDGTVYRKFKYGLLDDDDEDELEYDDESYSYK